MAQSGQLKRLAGPAYLANTATDILTAPNALLYNIIKHMHFANVTGSAATFTIYLGLTGGSAGGTELFKTVNLPANSTYDYYCSLKQTSSDYISGLASAGSTITIVIEGETVAV